MVACCINPSHHTSQTAHKFYSSWILETSISPHSPRPQKAFQNATKTDKTLFQLLVLWTGCGVPCWGDESNPFLAIYCSDGFSESRASVSVFCSNPQHNIVPFPCLRIQTRLKLSLKFATFLTESTTCCSLMSLGNLCSILILVPCTTN